MISGIDSEKCLGVSVVFTKFHLLGKYTVFLVFPETFVCIPTTFIVKTLHMALLMCSFIHLICHLLICSATYSLILLSQNNFI